MKYYGKLFKGVNPKTKQASWIMEDVPPHVCIRIKSIFLCVAQHYRQPFYFPDTPEMCHDLEWFISRYPMEIDRAYEYELQDKSVQFVDFQNENFQLLEGLYEAPTDVGFKDGKELRPFQAQAVTLFHRVKKLLIADGVGLGKTVEAIGALMIPETLPALVVVQSHLPEQWVEKIEEFSNLRAHAILPKKKRYDLPEADVYVIKYTNITDWIDYLLKIPFKTFIMDEVQEIRREESKKHKTCVNIAKQCEYIMGLSGTPVMNYGNEIYNLYKAINPDLFPDRDAFYREWIDWGKVKDPEALGAYLQEKCAYIRRTKHDVYEQLPPVNKIVHTVGYDQKALDKITDRAKILAHSVLEANQYIERGQAARELSIMVRKATGVSKAKYIADYVKMLLENGEKVLLAIWHREVYDILEKELKEYNPVFYSGTETLDQKKKSKEAFINGDSQIMFISLRSGVGLDGLQHVCSYVVIGELDWTGAMHEQIIGRLDRDGQKEQVTAIFLVSNSGSDPVVMDIIGIKKSQQDGIMNPLGKKEKQHSDDSIIKAYAKKLIES